MRAWLIASAVVVVAGCGDDITPIGPPLEPADTLFVVAHSDDDMVFMQPELLDALRTRSVTTVYVTMGDPVKGYQHAQSLLHATRMAYASIAGGSEWECGYISVDGSMAEHCRLRGRPVALIALDLTDGGIPGDRRDSLLHLVDGTIAALPVLGPDGGSETVDTTIDLLAQIIAATEPREIHALELAGTHGRDHSSHMFSSSFAFWAAARLGYPGPITWHRGYNVDVEAITLDSADYGPARDMLGYYEACADDCAPCGKSCTTLNAAHDGWLQRQYASTRVVEATGPLAIDDRCLTASRELADCAAPASADLDRDGHLTIGEGCLATTPDDRVTLEACTDSPAQYWVLDSEGFLWNGRPPTPGGDMSYTHVRCLSSDGASATAPTCGDQLRPHWRFAG
jgi:hypothetical protein